MTYYFAEKKLCQLPLTLGTGFLHLRTTSNILSVTSKEMTLK